VGLEARFNAERKQGLTRVKPKRKIDRLQATNLSNKGFQNPP